MRALPSVNRSPMPDGLRHSSLPVAPERPTSACAPSPNEPMPTKLCASPSPRKKSTSVLSHCTSALGDGKPGTGGEAARPALPRDTELLARKNATAAAPTNTTPKTATTVSTIGVADEAVGLGRAGVAGGAGGAGCWALWYC